MAISTRNIYRTGIEIRTPLENLTLSLRRIAPQANRSTSTGEDFVGGAQEETQIANSKSLFEILYLRCLFDDKLSPNKQVLRVF